MQTSKLEAAKVKVDADAKSYEILKADGLSAEAKYRIDKEVEKSIGVAKALAGPNGLTLPTTTITSGGSNSNAQTDLTNLLLLEMLQGKK